MSTVTTPCNAVLIPTGVLVDSGGYYLAIALLIFTPVYMLATCVAFLYYHKSSMLLRKRKFVGLVITCFQITSLLCYTAIYDFVGADKFPCLLLAITFNVFSAVQAINLLFKTTLYLNHSAELAIGKEIAAENALNENHSRPQSGRSSTSSVFRPTYIAPRATWKTFTAFCRTFVASKKTVFSLDDRIATLQFVKSQTYNLLTGPPVLFAATVTMSVRIALDPDMQNNCTGCSVSMYEAIVQLVLTAWGMVLSRNVFKGEALQNDTLRLKAELKETIGFPQVVPWLLGLILYLADPDGVNRTFNWLTLCLLCNMAMLGNHVWKLIYLSWRLRRDMFKSKKDLAACFEEVYADPELKQALCSLLDAEMSSEIYWFYDSVKFFKRTYDAQTDRTKDLAKFIMDNYVLSSAPYEVNISGPTRVACTDQYDDEMITKELFDQPLDEVMRGFYTDGFLRFLVKMEQNKLPNVKEKSVAVVSSSLA